MVRCIRHFGCRVLPDLFTWKRGSKWPKSSIVEFLAGEKSDFYINVILNPQVTALYLFCKHQKILRQTSTTEYFVHFCLFLMHAPAGLPLKGWISLLFIHTNSRSALFRFCVIFLPVFGRSKKTKKDIGALTCGFSQTAF